MARWGHFGVPVLILPSAGGDLEELERFQLIAALATLLEAGQIKVYSIDGIAIRAWLAAGGHSPEACARLQSAYETFVYQEVVQRIREDCQDPAIEPVLAGLSLGAFPALCLLCRYPDAFRSAIGLSGIYDLNRLGGSFSLAGYVATLPERQLEPLRHRRVILGTGAGDYETPTESQLMAEALRSKAVPCQLQLWGLRYGHSWASWCERLPQALLEPL